MESIIRDITKHESGHKKIEWVRKNMPLLNGIEEDFKRTRPFEGLRIALSIHLEAKTAYLYRFLRQAEQDVYNGRNPLSTQDDVAAELVKCGLNVYAWYNATTEEYNSHIEKVILSEPNIIIDDGGDLVNLIHEKYPELIGNVIGGCEKRPGIIRLKAMERIIC